MDITQWLSLLGILVAFIVGYAFFEWLLIRLFYGKRKAGKFNLKYILFSALGLLIVVLIELFGFWRVLIGFIILCALIFLVHTLSKKFKKK